MSTADIPGSTVSMSAEELSKLSLGDTMVTTRAGAARARTAQATQSDSDTESEVSTQSSSPTPSIITSSSGFRYNVSAFDIELRRRAKRGLLDDNDIKLKYCRQSEGHENEYMFFIDDSVEIVIGGRYDVPRCTCDANEGGGACRVSRRASYMWIHPDLPKHIFWLLNQLTRGAPNSLKTQTLQLPADGATVQDIQPAEMISNIPDGLEGLAEGLDWVHYDVPEPEERDIREEVADMLSVFEPTDALPAELKNPERSFSTERSRKYREFQELMSKFATENLGFFGRLQTVLDSEFQAQVFFNKVNDRIVRTFEALDEYIAHGASTETRSKMYNVTTCARELELLVESIHGYYHRQKENGYDTQEVGIRAASALIGILDQVASRNYDAYANLTWSVIPPDNPNENNLFVCLIGAPKGDGLFVLDALKELPHEEVTRRHWDTLLNIGERLGPQWTPAAFVDAFRAITSETRKRAASQTGGSSAKRPMQENA